HIEDRAEILTRPVGEVMTPDPLTISGDRLAVEALRLLGTRKVDEIPVVNRRGEPVGMLDVQDLLKAGVV
ncbi:MAG: CBS domain-containing protein, partial [Candidatus Erginobacter occultus]|nr:CBS domain-containing protein [Candidatus Erginobacter occultus]